MAKSSVRIKIILGFFSGFASVRRPAAFPTDAHRAAKTEQTIMISRHIGATGRRLATLPFIRIEFISVLPRYSTFNRDFISTTTYGFHVEST
jgi:hypothetical protein